MKEVKKGFEGKLGIYTYHLSDLETYLKRKEFFKPSKHLKKKDVEDKMFNVNITCNEKELKLGRKTR